MVEGRGLCQRFCSGGCIWAGLDLLRVLFSLIYHRFCLEEYSTAFAWKSALKFVLNSPFYGARKLCLSFRFYLVLQKMRKDPFFTGLKIGVQKP